jgi:hypothetical protein
MMNLLCSEVKTWIKKEHKKFRWQPLCRLPKNVIQGESRGFVDIQIPYFTTSK